MKEKAKIIEKSKPNATQELEEYTEENVSLAPDSAFPFWWIIVKQKNGKEMAVGAGKMEGLVCSKEELYQWVEKQFELEKTMSQGVKSFQPQSTSQDQIEFIKKAIEEGLDTLEQVLSKNKDMAKEFKLWKTKTFKT